MIIRTSSIAKFALLLHRARSRRATARVIMAPNTILMQLTWLPKGLSNMLEVICQSCEPGSIKLKGASSLISYSGFEIGGRFEDQIYHVNCWRVPSTMHASGTRYIGSILQRSTQVHGGESPHAAYCRGAFSHRGNAGTLPDFDGISGMLGQPSTYLVCSPIGNSIITPIYLSNPMRDIRMQQHKWKSKTVGSNRRIEVSRSHQPSHLTSFATWS